ncbi:MAG: hypothetical protein LBG24_07440 [Treponema sp.]|jgi:hypothetical protein|nr:hypothetical protein [Treponema sp.]
MNAHFSELFEYIRVIAGTSYDTSEFAVESISRWRETLGKHTFPKAKKRYIPCDCDESNRVKMWKYQLQQFANPTVF